MSDNRLLVVGPSVEIRKTGAIVDKGTRTVVAPCDRATDLVRVVADARRSRFGGQRIDVLDIHDHSRNNGMTLGGETLFDVTAEFRFDGEQIARDLAPHLSSHAHVRLLGCDVVFESEPGASLPPEKLLLRQCLLVWLADILGEERIVSGTNLLINRHSFNKDGLRPFIAQRGLFCSLAAVHTSPVGYTTQTNRIGDMLSLRQGKSLTADAANTDPKVAKSVGSRVAKTNGVVASCGCVAPVAPEQNT